ncbi:phosphoglycerate dehydrogenase, partial [Francisella tularensis]|nr:phosphoglycerate dehydrogenase [Francisella tularensis]
MKKSNDKRGEGFRSAENAYEIRGTTYGIGGYYHILSQYSDLSDNLGLTV